MKKFNFMKSFLAAVRDKVEKAATVISDLADESKVDLVLMGIKGLNFKGKLEITAVRVLQLAPCSVMIVS